MIVKDLIRSLFSGDSTETTVGGPRTGRPYVHSVIVPETSEVVRTPNQAMAVAAVYRCVKLISDMVAGLPFTYQRLRNGVYVPAEDRLNYLLQVQPNPGMSAFDFWSSAIAQILLQGNAYILPIIDLANPGYRELILVAPNCCSFDISSCTYTINDQYNGVSGTYNEDDIIHLKNYTFNGFTGESVLSVAARSLGIAATGDRETLDRFSNGGRVSGYISDASTTPTLGRYDTEEVKKHVDEIEERMNNGHRIAIIDGDLKFQQFSMNSADMQFLEQRKFAVRDICRFFGVHPSFVYDDTSNNYKSAEMANVAFLSNTLHPLLRKIEAEFCRKLISNNIWTKYRFEFDRSQLYACDLESKIRYQSQKIGAGLSTVNEERRRENKPEVEGGDTLLVSANLKSIEELTSQPAQQQPPKEEPTEDQPEE